VGSGVGVVVGRGKTSIGLSAVYRKIAFIRRKLLGFSFVIVTRGIMSFLHPRGIMS